MRHKMRHMRTKVIFLMVSVILSTERNVLDPPMIPRMEVAAARILLFPEVLQMILLLHWLLETAPSARSCGITGRIPLNCHAAVVKEKETARPRGADTTVLLVLPRAGVLQTKASARPRAADTMIVLVTRAAVIAEKGTARPRGAVMTVLRELHPVVGAAGTRMQPVDTTNPPP